MKETESQTIVINFNLTHRTIVLLLLAVLGVSLLGYLARGSRPVTAASPQAPMVGSSGLRQFYLTTADVIGDGGPTACTTGYHMASLWEIMDTSNLQYNTTLGVTNADGGSGPPTGSDAQGWVRTGSAASSSIFTPGIANCDGYSQGVSSRGTVVYLDGDWTSINPWLADVYPCWSSVHVWCVED